MATTVWHNGDIWINEHARTSALAACDGQVCAHGEQALELIASADEVVDLAGKTLLPGFGDGHAHPIFGGIETLFAPVRNKESVAEVLAAVAKWAADNPDAPWVRGEGYDPSIAPRGEFDAAWLDEIVSDRPVVLRAMDYHTAWVNTKALELAGITSDTPQPHDGEITLRPDGTPMGTLREWGAWQMVYNLLPELTTDQRIAAVQAASDAFASSGLTWGQDAWVEDDTLETWLTGANAGVLKFRVNLAWLAEPDGRWAKKLPDMIKHRARVANEAPELITGNSVKFFADGILEGGTAAVLEEYCDCPGSHGIPNWSRAELIEAVSAVVREGFQPHIHAIGDAGVRNALDAIEAAINEHGEANNPVIAHCQLVDVADLERFKKLGVIANFEPLWAQLGPEQTVLTIPRLGQERADHQYPIATLLNSETKLSFGSDWPVTTQVPMEGIGVAITRQTDDGKPEGGWVPSERITISQAIAAYTHGVAVQASEAHLWGTLEIGKRADITQLDCTIGQVTPMAVRKVGVLGTWLGGQRVY
jgi:predicted amidohydrolase YtcJ